jgi:hypothetical protein
MVKWWWSLDDCRNDHELSIGFLLNVETMMKMLMLEVDILLCCDEY